MPNTAPRLDHDFYLRTDVVQLSRELLGMHVVSHIDGVRTSGIIVETEAYRGPDDAACHAHLNKFTKRTRIFFERGGHAYVYKVYGMHHLFNIITAPEGDPHAILIRAIEPVDGVETMLERRGFDKLKPELTAGPGRMTVALDIDKRHYGVDMTADDTPIWIEDHRPEQRELPDDQIAVGTRVGIDYAGEDAYLPWRFWVKGNRWVSKAKGRTKD